MMKAFDGSAWPDARIGGLGFLVAGGFAGIVTLGLDVAALAALRAPLAHTCPGYNPALVEAAALAQRTGKPREAARLLSMRQDCTTPASPLHRPAR